MTYPRTAGLERELTPVVIKEIFGVREEQVLSLSDAIGPVATDWFHRATATLSAPVRVDGLR